MDDPSPPWLSDVPARNIKYDKMMEENAKQILNGIDRPFFNWRQKLDNVTTQKKLRKKFCFMLSESRERDFTISGSDEDVQS